jgi:hypothetical protein
MADEELSLSSGDNAPDDQASSGKDESEPQFAPDHDSEAQQPRPGSQDRIISPEEIRSQHEAVNNALKGVLEQQRTNSAQDTALEQELRALKEEASKAPPQEQPPMALPAPPNQDQKNDISVLATNVLKWGAIVGLAYGLTRRSPIRGSLFKLGLASALEAHYDGKVHDRNQALSLWEKNRQYIMDQNRLQHQQYMDTFNNRKLSLQQKMDVFREQAALWQNKRAQDAAIRGSIVDIQKMLNDEIRFERDFEHQMRQDRKEWYKLMGMDRREGSEYREWVMRKGGPDIAQLGDNADAWHKVESKYPRHDMLEEKHKEDQEREIETASKKAAAETRARYEEKQREKLLEERSSDNPLGLNLGP